MNKLNKLLSLLEEIPTSPISDKVKFGDEIKNFSELVLGDVLYSEWYGQGEDLKTDKNRRRITCISGFSESENGEIYAITNPYLQYTVLQHFFKDYDAIRENRPIYRSDFRSKYAKYWKIANIARRESHRIDLILKYDDKYGVSVYPSGKYTGESDRLLWDYWDVLSPNDGKNKLNINIKDYGIPKGINREFSPLNINHLVNPDWASSVDTSKITPQLYFDTATLKNPEPEYQVYNAVIKMKNHEDIDISPE